MPASSSASAGSHSDGASSTVGAAADSFIRRTESEIQLQTMLPRNGSELQISEMLDLFDQDALMRSPGMAGLSGKRQPTPLPLLPATTELPGAPSEIPPIAGEGTTAVKGPREGGNTCEPIPENYELEAAAASGDAVAQRSASQDDAAVGS